MNRVPSRLGSLALPLLLSLGVSCVASPAARAQSDYQIKPITQLGAKIGDVTLPSAGDHRFFLGGMADNGQLVFGVGPALANRLYQGTVVFGKPDWMLHWAKNTFTPIVVPNAEASATSWARNVSIMWPFGINRSGNVAFAATSSGSNSLGTYVWDAKEKRSISVAAPGTPAPDGGRSLTFTQAGGFGTAISTSGDVVFMGAVKDPNGPDGPGLFILGHDGKTLPILLPGTTIAGGKKLQGTFIPLPSVNDQGTVAFLARRQGDVNTSAFMWEQGNLQPIVLQGADAPGGKINAVTSVFLNNQNNHPLVTASVKPANGTTPTNRQGLYRVVDGKVVTIAAPGTPMPGGGTFRTLQNTQTSTYFGSTYDPVTICYGVSPANRWGEHIILAILDDGSTAAYRLDNRDRLSLVLKSGTVKSDLGTITRVGVDCPASINSVGQIALSVRVNNGVPALVVLSPGS
jgi:hypothetical protein